MNEILRQLMEIKTRVTKIERHLNGINATVKQHGADIKSMRMSVYKLIGGVAIFLLLAQGVFIIT